MVDAFIPGSKFAAVSITGSTCWLNCKYCMGKYLKGMERTPTPHRLKAFAKKFYKQGGRGILISGGFTREGKLPFTPFLQTIQEIKKEYGFVISVHPGLVSKEDAENLRRAGVDVVDFDFTLSTYVIKELKNLKGKDPTDFVLSLKYLYERGPPYIAPHLLVGLPAVNAELTLDEIDFLKGYDPYVTVFLAFIPTEGTALGREETPSIGFMVDILQKARHLLRGELSLGCMRPVSYKNSLDVVAIEKRLVERIAVPHLSIITKYGLRKYDACCSVPRELLNWFL